MDGLILIDKTEGITTRHIDNQLKHIYNSKKIGHAGTLDPFATGLVLVGVNQGTKALSFFEFMDKTYIATLKLGERTKSADKDTEVIESAPVPELTEEYIKAKLETLVGLQTQVPPMFSAIKIEGKPLYELARQDIEIERKARDIVVHSLTLLSYDKESHILVFEAHVSKGTYIRTLGEDIAKALGTLGYLRELRRTKIGKLSVDKAHKIEEMTADTPLLSIPQACYFITKAKANDATKLKIKNGTPLKVNCSSDLLLVVDENDTSVALAFYIRENADTFICKRGLML